ncbi:MAG: signal recognition particle-docking protein FtsY [Cuniculiplasma sp. C_DKE]|jgi:fused signal recognition particle receptor|uniref:Signal recognition particle receptor FtsY n=2 Tax=Cuniculiplasma divulgatum TaxID=1673428 RepID=A0A1N5T4R5_9ARCH|nr:MAG: hypothetical protein AMDU5_GPLC00004G0016 [Thermoplasmatales archaeon Gpl]MCI2412460.1 signal recognition particle-docking protein FtsY [Cuniculiplasma sp.]OWP54820.1 MAG: signal recognition particle-docking protein FtsY [Cuniculiplasma sp. C_DKE]WMT48654.1 MAG: signal recognition particle-docking protein FtsY [Thermoplasmatales archaeon]SIM43149.1 signal recognition particle receptor FtsY [Cuniculiplasma divulgatum]
MSLKEKLGNLFRGNKDEIELSRFRDEYFEILLESDVSLETVEYILDMFQQKHVKQKRLKRTEAIESLKEILLEILLKAKPSVDLLNINRKPLVIMFIGINGTGKTTTIARLSYMLKNKGKSVVVAASDTFRAGAIEQIRYHGDELGIRVISQTMGSDPSAIAFDAIEHARARNLDFVLIDTAGRMQTNKNLMDEMKKIKRVAKPDMTFLTVDAMAASDAIEQATTFLKDIKFDGIVVNKLDTDARGGAIFSIAHMFKEPIYFLGVGQKMEELIPYDPQFIIKKIFG